MSRAVLSVDAAVAQVEGDGLALRRALPRDAVRQINPFLLIEEIGPVNVAALVRTVQRPARGFEEVTWVLSGTVNHIRRQGGNDVSTAIGPNRAKWLTAGRGDVYQEEFAVGNGVRTLRIWIALPRADRDTPSDFVVEDPGRDELPMWTPLGAIAGRLQVDLLAGRLLGARSRIQPRTRVTIARLRIPADTTFVHALDSIEPLLEAPTVLLYGLSGQAMVGPVQTANAPREQRVRAQELAVLTPPAARNPQLPNSDEVRIRTEPASAFDVLWLSGQPVADRANEPFVQHGSLVMRTEEEILQAIEDYRTGRLGTLM